MSLRSFLTGSENDSPVNFRNWTATQKFQSNNAGTIITSGRLFGVEIECKEPSQKARYIVVNKMGPEIGMGTDSGVEWQTPILSGRAGEDYIEALCALLMKKSFTVYEGNGLHIHLDGGNDFLSKDPKQAHGENNKLNNLAQLFMLYTAFEDVIQSFVAPSRRMKNWCQPLRDRFSYDTLRHVICQYDLEKLWYAPHERDAAHQEYSVREGKSSRKNGHRLGINFSSLFAENHLEIRYHSGTIVARKILEWVNLHQTILDQAPFYNPSNYNMMEPYYATSLKEKTKMFFDLLDLRLSSRKYWLARQDKFEKKVELPSYSNDVMNIITEDNEILV